MIHPEAAILARDGQQIAVFRFNTKTNMTPDNPSNEKAFLTGLKQGQSFEQFKENLIQSLREQGYFTPATPEEQKAPRPSAVASAETIRKSSEGLSNEEIDALIERGIKDSKPYGTPRLRRP